MVTMIINSSEPESGYDLPIYGLDNGSFYLIHILAISCIVISLICAIVALVWSFKVQSYRDFFKKWSKSERFIVYLAICDSLYNISHGTDHIHTVTVKNYASPRGLCEFYGFILTLFVTAQVLMVNCVAINVFMLIYFDKNLNFGRRDWKLLLWIFGTPFIGAIIMEAAGILGPNGFYCFLDSVKGGIAHLCFVTGFFAVILSMNTILYILTWKRIHDQSLLPMSNLKRASHRAAKTMSLFVAAFFIQWWAILLFVIWDIAGDVPLVVVIFVMIFSNIGGVLNLAVLIYMRRKRRPYSEPIAN